VLVCVLGARFLRLQCGVWGLRLQGAEWVLEARRDCDAALAKAAEEGESEVAAALAQADRQLHLEVGAHLRYLNRQRDDLAAAGVALRARLEAVGERRAELVSAPTPPPHPSIHPSIHPPIHPSIIHPSTHPPIHP
jgi:hypothetical protein